PIWQIHDSVVRVLRDGNRLVLVAPTGSGKTTQVPQMILDAGLAGNKKIVVLQPRRVAARTVAARVAWERNVPLGGEVGYQIRFDDQTSLGTRICYVTEGILLRWLQDDRSLADVGVVLFDEFHERNLLSDVALALAKQLQQTARPDLKLAVMSATLEAEPVADYLASDNNKACPILVSEGQSFPVEVRYLDSHDERPVTEQAADTVERIVNSGAEGDILVFMPGMGEINATINACRAMHTRERLAFIPLHGELQPEEQDIAFAPNPLRKVVVATNVAETSVTIDGIRHVVDGGLARIARYDPERGIGTLAIEEISRASAEQRKGRAGRTAPGTCYRLWTQSGHLNRPERNTPEIQRSDLAEVVLLLHSLHIRKAAQFDWLDKPDSAAVERAENLLRILGALKPAEESAMEDSQHATRNSQPFPAPQSDLTPIGRQMMRLPMHPRYSRMLVEASRLGCVRAAALCAALVSGRDLLQRLRREDKHIAEARELFEASQDSDFFTLMRAYQFAKKNNFAIEPCRRYGINAQSARQVEQTQEQIVQIAEQQKLLRPDEKADDSALLHCIMAGFIDQLCIRRDLGTLECDLTEGRKGTLMRESVVQNASLFVAASIREVPSRGSENLTLLGLASAVKREWIEEMFPQHIHASVEHLFDRTHKRVAAVKLVRFRDLVIHHEHQRDADPEASGRCLAEAFRKGYFELPLFNHELKQFIGRVNLVCAVMPELEFPQVDDAAITHHLARAFNGMTLVKEAQATHLREEFFQHLAKEQLAWLDELAPLAISWPDGRKLKLLYAEEAATKTGEPNPPELQVKLHECFALKEHPQICEGRLPVKLWLCAPDG
ncbi:MAG TPA: ATP-dependent helicase C-terminal domain-containing protein, partial [Verrucomicrobiae bacterium]|nr:ATP-dependent helicase C-terminal domain-containing protein [Verrucomicrobiae bacterium]